MLFTNQHEWVEQKGNHFLIGITKHAAKELAELVFVQLPVIGNTYKKGETIAVVESTKTASDVYAPFDLRIVNINTLLINNPSLINSSPYSDGWICEAEALDPSQLAGLLSESDYNKLTKC